MATNGVDGSPAATLPPSHTVVVGLGRLHQHLHALQPRLTVMVDEWQTVCHRVRQMRPAVLPQQGPLALPGR